MQDGLVLRDLHRPPAPPFWPPAPGWWLVALVLLAVLAIVFMIRRRRARARAASLALFDNALDAAPTPAARLAAASELLRRAARRARPDADRLDGVGWLDFLDTPRTRFFDGRGRLLLDGPFRPGIDAGDANAALGLARRRFIELMERRR
jgi:cbb3-type cytochrome oxidase subunit 3